MYFTCYTPHVKMVESLITHLKLGLYSNGCHVSDTLNFTLLRLFNSSNVIFAFVLSEALSVYVKMVSNYLFI